MESCLDAALLRRADLLADPHTDVCRVFHSAADGVGGLVIEKLGDVLMAQLHEGHLRIDEPTVRRLCELAADRLGARAVYRKVFPRSRAAAGPAIQAQHRDPRPWIGRPVEPEIPVREAGAVYLIRPYDGYATGLFLDHRVGRVRLRELASGRRVLNAFAYTCGFTVAAALGGAVQTVSVDISKKSLEWGKRNLAANGIELGRHRFMCCDVFDYYRRAARQGCRFELLILDPPTFAHLRDGPGSFSLAADLPRLVDGGLRLLDPGGLLYLSVNHRRTTTRDLVQVATRAARSGGRGCTLLECPPLPTDFCGDPDYAKSVLMRID